MNKLSPAVIAICCIAFIPPLYSAEPAAYYGNIAVAVSEKNPNIRIGSLIDILSGAKNPDDKTVIAQLSKDLRSPELADLMMPRLIVLWMRHPEALHLAEMCAVTAAEKNIFSPDVLKCFHQTLKTIDFSETDPERKKAALNLLQCCNQLLMTNDEYPSAAGIFDMLVKKYPRNTDIILLASNAFVHGCFLANDTWPGEKHFQQLPENDIWKSGIENLRKTVSETIPENVGACENLVKSGIILAMPETAVMLKNYFERYPGKNWHFLSINTAAKFRNHELFIPCGQPYADIRGFLLVRNFPAVKRMLKKYPPVIRNEFELQIKYARRQYDKVLEIFNTAGKPIEKFSFYSQNAILSAMHNCRDIDSIKKIIQNFTVKNNPASFDMANTIGYIAADLNIELDKAERLIRSAMKYFPNTSAYHDSLAWVLFRKGDFVQADKEMMISLRLRRASHSVAVQYLHAAEIKYAIGKKDDAKKFLLKAEKLYDPNLQECFEYSTETANKLKKLLK